MHTHQLLTTTLATALLAVITGCMPKLTVDNPKTMTLQRPVELVGAHALLGG